MVSESTQPHVGRRKWSHKTVKLELLSIALQIRRQQAVKFMCPIVIRYGVVATSATATATTCTALELLTSMW